MPVLRYSAGVRTILQHLGRLPAWVDLLLIGLIGGMFVLLSLNTGINHDEDQYLGGAVLAWDRLIFRDFMHLQTPLQAWLFAPVAALFSGHALLALRVANASMAWLALAGVYLAQRSTGVGGRTALVATLLLALCPAFRISATLVRNDMAPLAFSAFGIAVALLAIKPGSGARLWLIAGLLFGLATSAKISHAFYLAGAGLFLLWQSRSASHRAEHVRSLLAYSVGALGGLLPIIIVFLAAPDAVRFGVVDYFGPGVFDWYRRNGHADMLTMRSNLTRMFDYLADGPALPASVILLLALVGAYRLRLLQRPEVRLLTILLAAGGTAALLPTPAWSYYLLTYLLPLFILFGVALEAGVRRWPVPTVLVAAVAVLWALPPAIDYARWTYYALAKTPTEWVVVRFEQQAHWIGDMLRRAGARGTIATLSPFAVVDSGYPLDVRFATGAFIFRSGHLISADDHARFHTVGPQTLRQALDEDPPAAILTGYQKGTPLFSVRPDDDLRRYAIDRGYRLHRSPMGSAQLFIAPISRVPCRPATARGCAHRRASDAARPGASASGRRQVR
jgi:hypothetical protein